MMNGLAPAVLSTASTSATTFLMWVMPRLPTPTAICAPGCNRDRTFCALNSCWTTAGKSSGGDTGNFCRTANMRGKGMSVLIFQFSFSVTTQSSVARNLKGCQTVAEGKATGRHPRKASANLFDPGGVAEFPDIFVSGNPRMLSSMLNTSETPVLHWIGDAVGANLSLPSRPCPRKKIIREAVGQVGQLPQAARQPCGLYFSKVL